MEITDNAQMNGWERAAVEQLSYATATVTRRSARCFDLDLEGVGAEPRFRSPTQYSAWLPLAMIGQLSNWVMLAPYSDYPSMVADGDWSGIRDSDEDTIWVMLARSHA